MKESKPKQFSSFLKRWFISTILISVVTFLQFYWSMGSFSDRISSGCTDCSFFEDAVSVSLITGGFLSIVFSLLFFVKKIFLKASVEFLLLIFVWLFWNYTLFVDRESSWSTYDFSSEIQYTVSLSFLPVTVLACWSVIIFHYQEIKVRFVS
ncbi:hypothetical protein ACR1PO_16500 [Chryseobacterium sp. RRHN12]|uniref:hypothetical protein n=1 Tax=Chryseobacterium sp. RRHN12 TaxID=3437884 RepID=UPI003D9BED91